MFHRVGVLPFCPFAILPKTFFVDGPKTQAQFEKKDIFKTFKQIKV